MAAASAVRAGAEFDFTIDSSVALAKSIYERTLGKKMGGWDRMVDNWLQAKKPIIDCLDKSTARVVLDTSKEIADGGSMVNVKTFKVIGSNLGINGVTAYLNDEEIRTMLVSAEGTFLEKFRLCGVKARQKVGRAIAAVLRSAHYGYDETTAAATVTKLMDGSTSKAGGKIVLSANILDILLSSEQSAFQTCHRLRGESCAGPLHYVADKSALVAYYYDCFKPASLNEGGIVLKDILLPYKTWRQIVHVDLENQAAVFMRHYGATISDEMHALLRREAAKIIYQATGLQPADGPDPLHWKIQRHDYTGEKTGSPVKLSKVGLAYLDAPYCIIKINGKNPNVSLTDTIPCPCCDKGTLSNAKTMICKRCVGPTHKCSHCSENQYQGDKIHPCYLRGGTVVCDACFVLHGYKNCAYCGHADMIAADGRPGGMLFHERMVCRTCLPTQTYECCGCGVRKVKSDYGDNRQYAVYKYDAGVRKRAIACGQCLAKKLFQSCYYCGDFHEPAKLFSATGDDRKFCLGCANSFIERCGPCKRSVLKGQGSPCNCAAPTLTQFTEADFQDAGQRGAQDVRQAPAEARLQDAGQPF